MVAFLILSIFVFILFFCPQSIFTASGSPINDTGEQSRSNPSADVVGESDKNRTDFLLTLVPTQNSYTRKTEILWIGEGNWAILVNGSLTKRNPTGNNTVNDKIIDLTAAQGDKTIFETFLKTGENGGFSAVFTPPSAENTIITAKLTGEDSQVQGVVSVIVNESYLPLIMIAILLSIAIAIILLMWTKFQKKLQWGIFLAAIPIILAFIVLARFPIYDAGGNSAIAAALLTPIAGYIIELMKKKETNNGTNDGTKVKKKKLK